MIVVKTNEPTNQPTHPPTHRALFQKFSEALSLEVYLILLLCFADRYIYKTKIYKLSVSSVLYSYIWGLCLYLLVLIGTTLSPSFASLVPWLNAYLLCSRQVPDAAM